MTKVLVAYGSERGATAEIAGWIADALTRFGLEVEIKAADSVEDVTPYDAVVLGGALYNARWHKDARRFARRHAGDVCGKAVWLFSSGPLDRSADDTAIPLVRNVLKASVALGSRGHRTFGGCLAADAKGFIASMVAQTRAGDYRDPQQVRDWAGEIAAELTAVPV